MVKLKKTLKHHTRLLIVVASVLITGGVVYAVVNNEPGQKPPAGPPSASSNDNGGQSINLNPATPEEKKATEDAKTNLNQPPPSPPTTPSGKKQVYPVITSANHSEVDAYVAGVVEDGGTCTAKATQGAQVITATSTGFANVSQTNCYPISIAIPAGWSVTVSYSSASSEGQSQALGVN